MENYFIGIDYGSGSDDDVTIISKLEDGVRKVILILENPKLIPTAS